MESPSPILLSYFFLTAGNSVPGTDKIGVWILYGLWLTHYTHRSLIQPLTNPGGNKPIPLVICCSAIFFNLMNGYINGRGLYLSHARYDSSWLCSPRTLVGLSLFFLGAYINYQAD